MKPLEQRVSALEAAESCRRVTAGQVLLAPHGLLTAEQQAQSAAARAAGSTVFIIKLVEAVRNGDA